MGVHGEGTVWREMDSQGGSLSVPEYGIVLTVPEGALPNDRKYKIFLAVLPRVKLIPSLSEKQVR